VWSFAVCDIEGFYFDKRPVLIDATGLPNVDDSKGCDCLTDQQLSIGCALGARHFKDSGDRSKLASFVSVMKKRLKDNTGKSNKLERIQHILDLTQPDPDTWDGAISAELIVLKQLVQKLSN